MPSVELFPHETKGSPNMLKTGGPERGAEGTERPSPVFFYPSWVTLSPVGEEDQTTPLPPPAHLIPCFLPGPGVLERSPMGIPETQWVAGEGGQPIIPMPMGGVHPLFSKISLLCQRNFSYTVPW